MNREAVTTGPRLAGRWLLLIVILVLAAETAYIVRLVQTRGIFDYIALDYRASRAAGEMLPEHGLGAPYDFDLIDARQRLLYQEFVSAEEKRRAPYYLVPVPYPPPFTLLFYPSTLLPPIAGYLAAGLSWTVAVCGMIVTALIGLACGRWLGSSHRREWGPAWLGVVAATCVFVWHSHVHLALLVVPLLYPVITEWPELRISVETTMFASPLFFIPTAALFSIGLAHDLLGQTIFILLLTLCTACLFLLRRNAGVPGSRSEIESDN